MKDTKQSNPRTIADMEKQQDAVCEELARMREDFRNGSFADIDEIRLCEMESKDLNTEITIAKLKEEREAHASAIKKIDKAIHDLEYPEDPVAYAERMGWIDKDGNDIS